MARTLGHVYFQGHTHGEVMSAVPDMSGFIFRFAVFLLHVCLGVFWAFDCNFKHDFFKMFLDIGLTDSTDMTDMTSGL